jgi:beta-1,4-mannosyl-glycoprotein beta-1,4-N-acetylglucosaminyltransferase
MKIFDCFMYFDEEVVLDIRLNTLNQFVDYFVIVESKYNHRGEPRELLFNQEKFKKFKDKIIYLVHNEVPKQIEIIKEEDNEDKKASNYIMNALYRENVQRNYIINGLNQAKENDLILISDEDEIPK